MLHVPQQLRCFILSPASLQPLVPTVFDEPILIVGAGPAGLALAALLSCESVSFILLEASTGVSDDACESPENLSSWAYEPLLSGMGISARTFELAVACHKSLAHVTDLTTGHKRRPTFGKRHGPTVSAQAGDGQILTAYS